MSEDFDFNFAMANKLDDEKALEVVKAGANTNTEITKVHDFGFSLVHANEFEKAFTKRMDAVKGAMNETAQELAKNRMEGLKELIMPLLINLMSGPDRDWIAWPAADRIAKIKAFIERLDAYIAS